MPPKLLRAYCLLCEKIIPLSGSILGERQNRYRNQLFDNGRFRPRLFENSLLTTAARNWTAEITLHSILSLMESEPPKQVKEQRLFRDDYSFNG
jgi:hypothetical protein